MLGFIKNYYQLVKLRSKGVKIMKDTNISYDSEVGQYTYIGNRCVITKSKIGRFCSIADNVSIGMGEHDLCEIANSSLFYSDEYNKLTNKECSIGNDVWIGVDSIIRRGCKIGDGVVIGANSFVNSDIPDFAIAVGSPAKVIKYKFDVDKISKIKESKWWNYSFEDAKKIISDIK